MAGPPQTRPQSSVLPLVHRGIAFAEKAGYKGRSRGQIDPGAGWYHGHPPGSRLLWAGRPTAEPARRRRPRRSRRTFARGDGATLDWSTTNHQEMKGGGCDDRDAEPSRPAGPGRHDDQA